MLKNQPDDALCKISHTELTEQNKKTEHVELTVIIVITENLKTYE